MTAKSIVQVEVDDSSFKDFVVLFNKYRDQLAQLPDGWNKVGDAIGSVANEAEALEHNSAGVPKAMGGVKTETAAVVALFAEASAALFEQALALDRQEKAQEKLAREAEKDGRQRNDAAKHLLETQEKIRKSSENTNKTWKDMANSAGSAAGGVISTVSGIAGGAVSLGVDILRWVGMGAAGLAGVGGAGLFGADKLAHTSDDMRRTAQGLGTTPGNEHALEVNFGRVIGDTGSYLSSIQEIAADPSRQWGIGADIAGMSARGMDTSEIGAALIPIMKQMYAQGGKNVFGMRAANLDSVVDLHTLNAISAQPDQDISAWSKSFEKDKSTLAIGDDHLKTWQDLHRDLERSGMRVEKALIDDLAPLAPELGKLSKGLTDFAVDLGDSVAPHLRDFAAWLDGPALSDAEKNFVDGLHSMAKRMGVDQPDSPEQGGQGPDESPVSRWMRHTRDATTRHLFGSDPAKVNPWLYGSPGTVPGIGNDPAKVNPWLYGSPGTVPGIGNEHALGATEAPGRPEDWEKLHNPGDLFVPGSKTQMLGFSSDPAGIRGLRDQLLIYGKRDHLDTIEGIIGKYAPPGQNDTETYIKNAVERTGLSRDEHLDLNDNDVAAKLISAITKQEHNRSNYSAATVVTILNQTGGSAVVSTSQLAQ